MVKIKKLLWYIYEGFGYGFLIGNSFVLIYTFMRCYFSPTKSGVVMINPLGEADVEFSLILCFIPFLYYFIWSAFKIMKKEKEKLKT